MLFIFLPDQVVLESRELAANSKQCLGHLDHKFLKIAKNRVRIWIMKLWFADQTWMAATLSYIQIFILVCVIVRMLSVKIFSICLKWLFNITIKSNLYLPMSRNVFRSKLTDKQLFKKSKNAEYNGTLKLDPSKSELSEDQISNGPNHLKNQTIQNPGIFLDFKWSGFRFSDPIWNLYHFQTDLFSNWPLFNHSSSGRTSPNFKSHPIFKQMKNKLTDCHGWQGSEQEVVEHQVHLWAKK